MLVFIDIETIPDQTAGAVDKIAKDLEVKPPSTHNKPDFIKDLGLGDQGKYKSVGELKDLWVDRFAEEKRIEQAKEKWLKTSFDGGKGELCCVGVGTSLDDVTSFIGNETSILNALESWINTKSDFIRERPEVTFIAHHKGFDLPFLFKRMVINGISPSYKFNPYGRKHICTMELWEGFNGKISLDNLADQLGVKGKSKGFTGADVWPMFQEGRDEEIAEYCEDDVRVLIECYNKIKFNK